MEDVLRIAGAVVLPYLLGSIPWAVIVVRVFWHQDIRKLGSGNTGATNVLRVFGAAPGFAVLFLDVLKGALGVLAAAALAPEAFGATGVDWFMMIGAFAAIAGHSFSFWIGFSGGKGVATAGGAIIVLATKAVPILLLIFIAAVAISRMVSVGSITAGVAFPIVSWIMYPERMALLVFMLAAMVFVIWRHRGNIGRIMKRTEPTITFKRRMWDEAKPHDEGSV